MRIGNESDGVVIANLWRTMRGSIFAPEREWLVWTAAVVCRQFEHPTFVNIGVGKGVSMHCLRAGCATARLVGVDIQYRRIAEQNALFAELVVGDSGKCWAEFEDPVHLLFVDGDHRLVGVMADIRGWTPKVVPGGLAVFHDYSRPQPRWQVGPAVDAWLAEEGGDWEGMPSAGSLKAVRRR